MICGTSLTPLPQKERAVSLSGRSARHAGSATSDGPGRAAVPGNYPRAADSKQSPKAGDIVIGDSLWRRCGCGEGGPPHPQHLGLHSSSNGDIPTAERAKSRRPGPAIRRRERADPRHTTKWGRALATPPPWHRENRLSWSPSTALRRLLGLSSRYWSGGRARPAKSSA
jgi:hypothetical protein